MEYTIKWSSGQALPGDLNQIKNQKINAADDTEAFTIAYILRTRAYDLGAYHRFFNIKNGLEDEKLNILVLYDYFDVDREEDLSDEDREDYEELRYEPRTASDIDAINNDEIDGGSPWIISIKQGNRELYHCDDDMEINEDYANEKLRKINLHVNDEGKVVGDINLNAIDYDTNYVYCFINLNPGEDPFTKGGNSILMALGKIGDNLYCAYLNDNSYVEFDGDLQDFLQSQYEDEDSLNNIQVILAKGKLENEHPEIDLNTWNEF